MHLKYSASAHSSSSKQSLLCATIAARQEQERAFNPALYRASFGWDVRHAHRVNLLHDGACCTCFRGQQCATPGKHQRGKLLDEDGQYLAMPEISELALGWASNHWNVALLTGARSHVLVADVDPRHDGTLETLWSLGWPSDTVIACSGGGGWHVYAQCPDDGMRSIDDYAQGIELKADGKLVIAPPSVHPSGRHYEWLAGHSPFEIAVAALPDSVLAAIYAHARTRAEHDDNAQSVGYDEMRDVGLTRAQVRRYATKMYRKGLRSVREDHAGRNNTMYWLARQLQSVGMSERDVLAWVEHFGEEVRYG